MAVPSHQPDDRGRDTKGKESSLGRTTRSAHTEKAATVPHPPPMAAQHADGAVPLTRSDASSSSVRLADWARSHRSITRGSSNSGREHGKLREGAAAPMPPPARPARPRARVAVCSGSTQHLPSTFSAEATGPTVLAPRPPHGNEAALVSEPLHVELSPQRDPRS